MLLPETEKRLNIILKAIIYSAAALAIYFSLKLTFIYFSPFITAFILSLIIEPLVKLFQKLKLKRGVSVLISILLFLGGFIAFSVFAVTRIIYELMNLYNRLPNYYDGLSKLVAEIIQQATDLYLQLPPEALNIIQNVLNTVFQKLTTLLSHTTTLLIDMLTALPSTLIFLVITLIATFFFTKDKYLIRDFIFKQLPSSWNKKLTSLKTDLFGALVGFLKAQSIILSITFIESFIGLTIIGVDYAFTLAIVIALVDILPVLGTGGIYVPWAVISITMGNYRMGIALIVLYGIITIVRYMTEPKVVGQQLGIHPALTLISMFIGMKLIGAVGLILGPTAVVSIKACQNAGIIPKFK
ncbi:MAG TPA: sporulation integral membrane protein YtvI [Bacillota bacterium]|nr:sporulation integral membrane protein YtvI [Bacillota bacterium]HPL53731.1 sporulation integral membrane protein YtvI [Bacillota bacterium]